MKEPKLNKKMKNNQKEVIVLIPVVAADDQKAVGK